MGPVADSDSGRMACTRGGVSQLFVACWAQVWTGEAPLEWVQGGPAGRLMMMGEPEHSWGFRLSPAQGGGRGSVCCCYGIGLRIN